MSFADLTDIIGLYLFYFCLFWLPVMIARSIKNQGAARRWSLLALVSFVLVLLGYTWTVANVALPVAVFRAVAWIIPIWFSLSARKQPEAVWRSYDIISGIIAAVSFFFAAPILPPILLGLAIVIWS